MQIDYIGLDRLSVTRLNMRGERKQPNVSDIPSIRARGVLASLFVRSIPVADGNAGGDPHR